MNYIRILKFVNCFYLYRIESYFHRKVVANDWYGNGIAVGVRGKIEFSQQSEYEITNIEVNLKGLMDTSSYHIHVAPVQGDLEFPCEASTLYDHFNPHEMNNIESSLQMKESLNDLYDLSGKYGSLDHLTEYAGSFNDTDISLYGYNTILGRSIVIHKKKDEIRWACTSLVRGYSSNEAREIRAIASFHHPKGHAYGYIRFTQLIHTGGSKSDTAIEVNLRYPGKNDRNIVIECSI